MKQCWHDGSSKLLPKLLQVIKKHQVLGFAVVFNPDEFNEVIKGKISREFDHYYAAAVTFIGPLIAKWQIDNGINEKVGLVFDEKTGLSRRLQSSFRGALPFPDEELSARISSIPLFSKDDEVLPLQAADLLAWSIRRHESFPSDETSDQASFVSQLRREIPVILNRFNKEVFLSFRSYIGSQCLKRGTPTEYQVKFHNENLDKLIHTANADRIRKSSYGQLIPLAAFPAKQMSRFRLIHKCPLCDTAHLHRRVGDVCLGE